MHSRWYLFFYFVLYMARRSTFKIPHRYAMIISLDCLEGVLPSVTASVSQWNLPSRRQVQKKRGEVCLCLYCTYDADDDGEVGEGGGGGMCKTTGCIVISTGQRRNPRLRFGNGPFLFLLSSRVENQQLALGWWPTDWLTSQLSTAHTNTPRVSLESYCLFRFWIFRLNVKL